MDVIEPFHVPQVFGIVLGISFIGAEAHVPIALTCFRYEPAISVRQSITVRRGERPDFLIVGLQIVVTGITILEIRHP